MDFLFFFENEECKCIDLKSLEIDGSSIGETPIEDPLCKNLKFYNIK